MKTTSYQSKICLHLILVFVVGVTLNVTLASPIDALDAVKSTRKNLAIMTQHIFDATPSVTLGDEKMSTSRDKLLKKREEQIENLASTVLDNR